MGDKSNLIPQVGTSGSEGNPTTGSDRVKASVAGACSTDSGGSNLSQSSQSDSKVAAKPFLAPATSNFAATGKSSNENDPSLNCAKQAIQLKLGKKIEELVQFVQPRHNVHGEIKRLVRAIKSGYLQLMAATAPPSAVQTDAITQTSPRAEEPKVQLDEQAMEQSPLPRQAKRQLRKKRKVPSPTAVVTGFTEPEIGGPKPKKSATADRATTAPTSGSNNGSEPTQQPQQAARTTPAPENTWKQVTSKKASKKPRKKSVPHNALILHKTADHNSYADILRNLKRDPKLNKVGERVNKIRRTAAGDLLFVFGKTDAKEIVTFRDAIRESLQEGVTVESRIPETEFEIKDLDEFTTKGEVARLLMDNIEGLVDVSEQSVKSMRRAYGSTQTAVVSIPELFARKAIQMGKIRLPWGVIKIRERISPKRCFRCWHFGHNAQACRGRVDRSKNCFRCGGEGHNASGCDRAPYCLLCKEKGGSADCGHVAGGLKCPIYQQAMRAAQVRK